MALLPTLLAIAIGVGLGMYWGGRISNLLEWVPPTFVVRARKLGI